VIGSSPVNKLNESERPVRLDRTGLSKVIEGVD
jgi:hypothetical protein